MRLKDFHCGVLEVSFDVSAEEIDTDALIKEIGSEDEGDWDISLVFDSEENPGEQHAHMSIQSRPKEKVSVRISYHDTQGKVEDNEAKPPRMEDCVKWLGKFIKPEKIMASVDASYFFDENFSPRVRISYPLKTLTEAAAGALVTGVAIQFSGDSLIDFAIVQRPKDISVEFGVAVTARYEIAIKDFDLYAELKRLESPVMTLVKKRARRHEKRDEK